MFRHTITPKHRIPGCQSGVSGLRFLPGSAERGAIVLDLNDAFPGERLALGVIRTHRLASATSARTISMTTTPRAITFFIGFRPEVLLGVLCIWHGFVA